MIRRALLSLAALAALVGLAVGTAMLTPARRPAPSAIELPSTSRVICPVAGTVLAGDAEALTVSPVFGGDPQDVSQPTFPLTAPAVLSADSLLAAGVYVEQPQRAYAPCLRPVTSGLILVDDPANAELLLVNGDAHETSVDLTLLGPDGEVTAVGARGIQLAPGDSRPIALSVLAGDRPVGVSFRASTGRVVLIGKSVDGRPTRYISPTVEATEHLLTGIPAGATSTSLLVTNPFEQRVDVSVEAFGPSGPYDPAATAEVSLPPMSTMLVDLTESLAAEATGLRVTADTAIGAAVTTTVTGPPATIVSGVLSDRLALNAPSGGALVVTNPGQVPAAVTVTTYAGGDTQSQSLTVAPGSTATLALPESGDVVSVDVLSDTAVVASAASSTEAGTVVVQGVQSTLADVVGVPAHFEPTLR